MDVFSFFFPREEVESITAYTEYGRTHAISIEDSAKMVNSLGPPQVVNFPMSKTNGPRAWTLNLYKS